MSRPQPGVRDPFKPVRQQVRGLMSRLSYSGLKKLRTQLSQKMATLGKEECQRWAKRHKSRKDSIILLLKKSVLLGQTLFELKMYLEGNEVRIELQPLSCLVLFRLRIKKDKCFSLIEQELGGHLDRITELISLDRSGSLLLSLSSQKQQRQFQTITEEVKQVQLRIPRKNSQSQELRPTSSQKRLRSHSYVSGTRQLKRVGTFAKGVELKASPYRSNGLVPKFVETQTVPDRQQEAKDNRPKRQNYLTKVLNGPSNESTLQLASGRVRRRNSMQELLVESFGVLQKVKQVYKD